MAINPEIIEIYNRQQKQKQKQAKRKEIFASGNNGRAYYDELYAIRREYQAEKAYKEGRLQEEMAPLLQRIEQYGSNYNNYVNEYYKRYGIDPNDPESLKPAYDQNSYRDTKDTQSWLDAVTSQRDGMAKEAAAIKRELEFYEPYIDGGFYGNTVKMFDNYGAGLDSMVNYATSDRDRWAQYENEDAYKDAYYNYTFGQKYAGIDTVEKWQEAWDVIDSQYSQYGEKDEEMGPYYVPDDILREREYLSNLKEHIDVKNYDADAAEKEIAELQAEVSELWADINEIREIQGNPDASFVYETRLAELAQKWGLETSAPQQSTSIVNNTSVANRDDSVIANANKSSIDPSYQMRRFNTDKALEDLYYSMKQDLADMEADHSEMSQKQQELLKYEEYEALRQNQDFEEKSKYDQSLVGERTVNWGATILQGSLDLLEGMATTGMSSPSGLEYNYDGLEYGFVNGDPQATQWYIEEYREDNSAIGDLIRGETEGYNLYTFLEENEKEMYNYIYKFQGEEAAHEYLEFLASDLKTRKANERAEWFKKQPTIGKIAYSVPVGIDQFVSGAEGIFKDEYDPSVTSMVGQEIRKDLADEGKILWYNIADGSWNTMKVMGSSGAQMLYDIGTTTSNMLPSILVSAAVEAALPTVGEGAAIFAGLTATQKAARIAKIAGAAGSLTLGASAVGNAKQEMLGMGYSVEQANAYGLMVGASEAGLSYMISGIPGLRGGAGIFSAPGKKVIGKVDNALAKAAIALGGNMLDEGLEEGLQTVLEGWFKEIATGVDFEDPSIDEILYSSLLGALTAAGFGGGKLAIDGTVSKVGNAIGHYNLGKSYVSKGGAEGVSSLTAQGLELNQNTAAYKQASKVQANLDKGKSASNYSVGKLLSSMSESQTSTAVQTRLSAHIENKTDVRKLSNTITDILYGREVSDKAIKTLAANKYALNTLNDVLGSKLNKGATVSDVRAAVKSYQNASTKAKQGSASKISGRGDVQFAAEKNADGGYDVVGTKGSEKAVFGSFKSQKQAQAAAYAMTLGMGAEGLHGLVTLSENLPDGVDLGEAALAFNAFYNQGKSGKALSAAKNMEFLSPEQRQYAYNLGIMDKALDGARKKSSGEVLQSETKHDKINNNKESAENEQGIRLRDGSERNDGKNTSEQVSAVESGTRQDSSRREAQRRPSDAAAASGLDLGEEVDAQSLGLEGGLDSGKVRLIKDGSENESMVEAKKLAEEHGLEAIFFAGGDLHILKVDPETRKEDVVEARGYIEGNRVYIRVDHPRHAPDQIMRHEICHDMIDNGEIDVNEVRERIKAQGVDVEYFIDRYSEAYALSGAIMGPDDVWIEIICDSYGDMNEFASVAEFGKMNAGFLSSLKGEVEASRKDARGPPKSSEGRASAEFGQYTKEQYESFGWVRANNVINAGYWRNFTENFAQAVSGNYNYPKNKDGEFMIDVYDAYDSSGVTDVIVFASGTIESPNVTKIVKIDANDSTDIEYERREILETERRGIQQKVGEFFRFYYKADFIGKFREQGVGSKENRNSGGFETKRRSSEVKANRIVEFHIDEERNTVTTTYANGETVTERLGGHASQDLDFFDYLNENAGDADITESETVEERELTNREILASALESTVKTEADRRTLRQYKRRAKALDAMEAELGEVNEKIRELSFAPGPRDKVTLTELKKQKAELEKKIHIKDKALTMLEVSEPLKKVLEREKKRAADKAKAEAREALAAQKARAKEALDKQAKRYQEMRERATEGRHKTVLRNKIKGVVAELDTLLRKGNKKRNVKLGLQDAVAAALEAFDVNADKVERYNKAIADLDARIAAATDPVEIEALTTLKDKKQRNSEQLQDKLQVMKKAYEDIHNGRDEENYPAYYKAEAKAIESRISEVIEKVGNTPIGEMSMDQLQAVYDMYRMVLTTVRDTNKVFLNGKQEELTENADSMAAELKRVAKLPEERLKAGDQALGFVWNELTPYYAFKRVGSETLMRYYDELVRGQDVYARDIAEVKEFAAEARKKYKADKWKLDEIRTFKDKDGRSFRLTLRHMMSIYAYSKREQAFDHMEKGGFFFNNKETFRKKGGVLEFIASNESGYKVDAATFAKIKSALTTEQIAYVDEMQAYLTQMGEKGNEVTRQMWGIDLFKEKAYFPLKSKEDFIYQANTPAETSSLKNDGMTKETKPHASNPIVLESFDDVWANHVEKMSKYHGFVIPIDNLNKILNYGTWLDGETQSETNGDSNVIDLSGDTDLSAMVEGIYGSAKYKKIAQYILNVLGKKEISLSDGRLTIVDNSDALHIANRAAPRKTAKIAKIKEIIKNARIYAQDANVDHNKFDLFYYYEAAVRYDGETFPVYLNIGRAKNDGKYHIYDITNKIRDTADRINGLERPKPNEGYALKNGISNNSISQPDKNVNRNFSTNSEMGSHSISTMLEARFGPGVNDYLNTFIKDLNGAKAQRGGVVGGAFDLLTKFKKTSVAASLSVVVQQPTAILRATSEIDPKYFVYLSKPGGLNRKWNQIKKYAPIAIIKDIGGFDAGSGKQITEWMNADTQRGTKKVLNKIDDLTMYGAALGDRIGWGAIWQAVIREVQAKQGLTYGTEEFWQACGKRFTDVIVKTQVYDSTLSRSGFMRGKDGLMKMATAFMGEPTLSINMLSDTLLQAKRGKISKGQVVRTFAAVYTATVAASIIKSFIYALRDDDEDEAYAEKYMQAVGGTILNDINPLSMLPILRDVVSIFEGWDVERTDMAVVQDLYNAINSLDSEKKTTYRKIEDLAGAVAALVGVPVKNVMRTAREIYNAIDDIFDGIDGGDLGGAFLEGITGEEKGKTQTLYEALIDGNPDRIYAIKKTYKTEETYLAAVRKALRTYDPRIKEAAQAQIDGDISRRNALLRKIVGEGIFDEITVSKAIAAEVNSIKDEESSSAEPEDDIPWYDRKEK